MEILREICDSDEKKGKEKGKQPVMVMRAKPKWFLSETRDPDPKV